MRLRVIYSTDGRIVSVTRALATDAADAAEPSSPEVAVVPREGERVAFVEIDSDWEARPIAEIHQAHTVVDGADGPSLRPHDAAT